MQMIKLMKQLIKIIAILIWRPIRTFWSNFYWRHFKHAATECPLDDADLRHGDESPTKYICRIDKKVMDAFEYKHDGIDELGDTTPPPAEMYRQMKSGHFADDCDGYHACLYHLAKENGIFCRLVSVLSAVNKRGHCVLLYLDGDGWHIHNYRVDYNDNDRDKLIYELFGEKYGGTIIVFEAEYDGKWHDGERNGHILKKDNHTI